MAKLSAAAVKLKTKALKSVTRNKTINSQLPNISDDWLAKPIVGTRIRATTGGNGGPQLTSPFKREQDASLAERVKLREQRRRLIFRTTNTTVGPTPWSPLRRAELKILSRLQRQRRVRKRPRRFGFLRPYKADRSLPDGMQIANINHLRSLLSLDGSRPSCDVTFVSIDCEFTQVKGVQYVTEIGITTLRASDVTNTAPGLFIRDWTSKLKHHHMVVNYGKTARWKEKSALFAHSQHVSGRDARIAVQKLMKAMIPSDADSQGYFALVGHSTWGDIDAMIKCPDLAFDIRTIGGPGLKLLNVFDTYWLGMDVKREGADLSGLSLGTMANSIGIDPVYRSEDAVIGWHNASNDAAYTMMCLLTFAADWNIIIGNETRSAAMQDEIRCAEAAHTAECTVLANGKIQRAGKAYESYDLEARRSARRNALNEARELLLATRSTASLASSSSWSSSWWSWLKGLFSSQTRSANEVASRMAERLVDGEKRKHESYLRQGDTTASGKGRIRVKGRESAQGEIEHEPGNEARITSDNETRAKEVPQVKTKRGSKGTNLEALTLAMKQRLLDAVVGVGTPQSSGPNITTAKDVPHVESERGTQAIHDNDGKAPRDPRAARAMRVPRVARVERVPRMARTPRTSQAETKHEAENVDFDEGMSTEVCPEVEATHQSVDVELDERQRPEDVVGIEAKTEPGNARLEEERRAKQVLRFQARAKIGNVEPYGIQATTPQSDATHSNSPTSPSSHPLPEIPPRHGTLCHGTLCHGTLCHGTLCQTYLCPGPIRIASPPRTIGPDDAPILRSSKRQRIHNRIVVETRALVWWKHVPLYASEQLQVAFYEDVKEREERELGRFAGKGSWWREVRERDERRLGREMRVMKGGLLGR
ncbi:hypothetical protein TI39_contig396g00003 [Zymoseptoria brevis]|uniref:Gfd2/YDR514C-like C-terminal domain-containing protein n=1 Tax=Zymoseptoria brevis TaxID=1047168 RepID=A0A0F4GR77_9PEZI|nr:hypothetical protein TI39_contig396g00003 [Zymoseptoria brevis]